MSKTIIDVTHFEFRWSRVTRNCCKVKNSGSHINIYVKDVNTESSVNKLRSPRREVSNGLNTFTTQNLHAAIYSEREFPYRVH